MMPRFRVRAIRPQIFWAFNVLGVIAVVAMIMDQSEIAATCAGGIILIAGSLLELEKSADE